MDTKYYYPHIPVLTNEVLYFLSPKLNGRYIDATVGCGGHALNLLTLNKSIQLLGIDRDPEAIDLARKRLSNFGPRVCFKQGNFSSMKVFAHKNGWQNVDGILMDLGMSSLHTEKALRGFSFQKNGPLDMRMNQNDKLTAFRLLNTLSERELSHILCQYGEEPKARKIAAAIVDAMKTPPKLQRTLELAELIKNAAGITGKGYSKTVARCFQAIRIAINEELVHLQKGLDAAIDLLKIGGRVVAISFHSLEDRIVKNTFRFEAAACTCPPGLPLCQCGKQVRVRPLTKKPVTAQKEEWSQNRKARSAKLRAAERV